MGTALTTTVISNQYSITITTTTDKTTHTARHTTTAITATTGRPARPVHDGDGKSNAFRSTVKLRTNCRLVWLSPTHTFPDLQQNEQSGIERRLDQQGTQIQQIQQMMHSLVQQRQQSPAPSPPQQHQQEQEQQGQQEHVFRQSNQIKSSKNWRN